MLILDISPPFGWANATIKINGNSFGKTAAGLYVGLKVGTKTIQLKTIQWGNDQISVQLPAEIPSRAYSLSIFKSPLRVNVNPGVTVKQIIPVPGLPPGPYAGDNMDESPDTYCNHKPFFITLEPPKKMDKPEMIDAYFAQVSAYRKKYGWEAGWEIFMTNYAAVENFGIFNQYNVVTEHPLLLSYEYEKPPKVPFTSETAHLQKLEQLMSLEFPGEIYKFKLVFGKPTPAQDRPFAKLIGASIKSENDPNTKKIYLKTDAIIGHEFGHRMGLSHHYVQDGMGYAPVFPGEKCRMNLQDGFCRACCMAIGMDYTAVLKNLPAEALLVKELNAHFL